MNKKRVISIAVSAFLFAGVAILLFTWRCNLINFPTVYVPYKPDPSQDDTRISLMVSKSLGQVCKELGPADIDQIIRLQEVRDELRCELLNFYPLRYLGNRCVRIRELWWKHNEYTTTIWFHQVDGEWVVLDTCRRKNDTDY
jgi:hypothetical protein